MGVIPLIEEPVFVLDGPSVLHFPAPLNLLMAEARLNALWPVRDSQIVARLAALKRNASRDQFLK